MVTLITIALIILLVVVIVKATKKKNNAPPPKKSITVSLSFNPNPDPDKEKNDDIVELLNKKYTPRTGNLNDKFNNHEKKQNSIKDLCIWRDQG